MIGRIVAAVAIAGNLCNAAAALASARGWAQLWPPGERDWRYWLAWVCWGPALAGLLVVGLLDAESAGLDPGGFVLGTGGAFLLCGLGLRAIATYHLGITATEGRVDELRTDGVYAHTRNPQYLGDILAMAGWVLVTDSMLAGAIAASALPYYILLPRAEEPWLREQYGEAYEAYADAVPRWIDRRTLEWPQR